jgi:S1-C subfamily serine protease
MLLHLDHPTFRFHLRCALLITMSAAFVTLFGVLYFSADRMNQLAIIQRGSDAEAHRLQLQLNRQMSEIRAERAGDIAQIEEQLRAIDERQVAGDQRAKTAVSKSPFPIDSVLGSVVEIVCIDNGNASVYYTGSGTVVDPSGLIVTNRHVLASDDKSLIRYCGVGFTNDLHVAPKIAYIGTVVATRESVDLALLKITEQIDGLPLPKSFAALDLAGAKDASLALNIGDPVFIGGYPGLGSETFTFTSGVVSGRVGNELIKTSALIDSGASGGAVFNADGAYVGIPTAAAKGEIGGSLGYLIGANVVNDFMAEYRQGKNLVPPLPVPPAKKKR